MLTQKQIEEVREHLDKAQNPLFFFDNDNDGLTSFLLLRRFIDRGKGVAVKGAHNLNQSFYRRVNELKPDYIFILDVPNVDPEFLKKAEEDNLPVVWIDHHNVEKPKNKEISYYNPYHNDKTNEPVCYLCYKITGTKQDMWIAMIGCISDYYMPDFLDEFSEKYPELVKKNAKTPFDLVYRSEIGRIATILDFSLKDTTTNVVSMLKFMMNAKGPMDILEENHKTKRILERYNEINTRYQELIKKAMEKGKDKVIYFQYGGDLSLSANIANELSYEFPDKIIAVAYVNTDIANISLRGKHVDIREFTLEAIKDIPGAVGGGHKHATGVRMNVDDLPKFKEKLEELSDKIK